MKYRDRFNDELEQIKLVQSVGNRQTQSRQHASRESAIAMAIEDDTHQFEGSGIEVPDLINKKNLETFKNWDGETKYIQNLKMRKLCKLDLIKIESLKEKSEENMVEDIIDEDIVEKT